MAWRIVQQPDGKLARFSDVCDDFTDVDLTYEEPDRANQKHDDAITEGNMSEELTHEQQLELAACYCEWCGVDPEDRDEWRREMVTAKRHIREWMVFWRKRKKRNAKRESRVK